MEEEAWVVRLEGVECAVFEEALLRMLQHGGWQHDKRLPFENAEVEGAFSLKLRCLCGFLPSARRRVHG
ncbi:hypothetical protein PIB30_043733 [Stylosanthes scabra]|uniref:Uncharacterized protein n=1 Tax=Stylosanthes scabra TaxID=79078 RepID=A0ABU6WHM7_9FABA|nr:hypothetical protein [Stylosanthes scabra]